MSAVMEDRSAVGERPAVGDRPAPSDGRTSANNLDEGISRLDKTLNKIYLPEIMAARRVIHSRMRRKRERQLQGPPRGGPTLYDYIMDSRRRKLGSQQHSLGDVPEGEERREQGEERREQGEERREHKPPTRQDSSFQSMDLSEIAGLREDPNRTPTPQPTFTDGPPPNDAMRQAQKTEAVAALSNSRSSSGQSSSKSEEIHEIHELQVRPGYADARQVEMATAACQSQSERGRSRSVHETSSERHLERRQNSASSDPGEVREKSVKKKQTTRQSNDLDLAQKIILKRKVEEYIDRQEPETTMEDVENSEEIDKTERESAWVNQSESHQATESVIVSKRAETQRAAGRESVQTVVSHRSSSSSEDREVNSREVITERSEVTDGSPPPASRPSSRSPSAGSDLNPHPVIPPIGTPPVSEEPADASQTSRNKDTESEKEIITESGVSEDKGTEKIETEDEANGPEEQPEEEKPGSKSPDEEEGEDGVPGEAIAAASVVAAGTGAAAAVAIKANKSETVKEKVEVDNTKEQVIKAEESETVKEKSAHKKVKQQSAKVTKASEEDTPKVAAAEADAAAGNVPPKPQKVAPPKVAEKPKSKKPEAKEKAKKKEDKTKPEKKTKEAKNREISLKDMSSGELQSTIEALDKMVDSNIQDVIDSTQGKNTKVKDDAADRKMVKAVMNPAFQAEINDFLAKT